MHLHPTSSARSGRKPDLKRSAQISDAALVLLTEPGYERMTIDMVPVRAKTARATVCRRWATKADLVTWIIDVANAG